ncbi:MAG: DsbA family protein [Candidatus Calescibacterium sp.]|nr:DsbA family protein [Candidatus Calescibacterium sp.]MCX7733772.1 DsbA family protein [bacterium]MDW8087942.1 DsbA family protein [Candidatus Calescibacterium sp.]
MKEKTYIKNLMSGQASSNFLAISVLVSAIIVAGSIVWGVKSLQDYFSNLGRNILGMRPPQAQQPQQPQPPQPPAQPPAPPPADVVDLSQVAEVPPYRVKGNPKAKVTIIEYSEFQCPFCGRFVRDTLPQIEKTYGDKVKIVFKHLPLPFHQYAQKAAEAVECAGKIGGAKAFWALHDKLFYEGQPTGRLDIASLKEFAKQVGLDEKKFSQCLDTGEMAGVVAKDLEESQRLGVRGTPTFFVNGKVVRGALPFEIFKQIIDQELQAGG